MKYKDKIIPACTSRLLWLIIALIPVTSPAVDTFSDTVAYFGGSGDERALAVAGDASGNIYVTGQRSDQTGLYFPQDAFVTKLAPDGHELFSTVIGTSMTGFSGEQEQGRAIAIDPADGAIYVAGSVASASGSAGLQTTAGAYDTCDNGNVDAFLAVLEPDGTLRYLTCFGGDYADYVTAMTLNSDGSATLVGYTYTTQTQDLTNKFPLKSAFQTQKGSSKDSPDAFVIRISPLGNGANDLLFSSYLGGTGADVALAVAADASGNVFITGSTSSANLPWLTDTNQGADDIFVTRLDAQSDDSYQPIYTRLLGGDSDASCEQGNERGSGIAVDDQHLYITGRQAWIDGSGGQIFEAIIARLDVAGSGEWNVQTIGSSLDPIDCGSTLGQGIILDGQGGGYVAGVTTDPEMLAADQVGMGTYHGGKDGFVTRFDGGLNPLYTHYLGGAGDDAVYALACSSDGRIQLLGGTDSDGLPTSDGSVRAGGTDVMHWSLLNADADLAVSVADQGPALFDETLNFDLVLSNNGPDDADAVVFEVNLPADFPGTLTLPSPCTMMITGGWSCALGTLPVATEVTLSAQLTSPQVGQWSFSYSLQGSAYELHAGNDRGQFDVDLVSVLPLQIGDGGNTAGASGGGVFDVLCLFLLLIIGYRRLSYPVWSDLNLIQQGRMDGGTDWLTRHRN